jgi:hypothetical protein
MHAYPHIWYVMYLYRYIEIYIPYMYTHHIYIYGLLFGFNKVLPFVTIWMKFEDFVTLNKPATRGQTL